MKTMVINMLIKKLLCTCIVLAVSMTTAGYVSAQPSQEELAKRVDQINQKRIQNIDRLELTYVFKGGILEGHQLSSQFEKIEKDGRYFLKPTDDDGDDLGDMIGITDDMAGEMIRNASTITYDTYNGFETYKIVVDDEQFLRDLAAMEPLQEDDLEIEFDPESFTFWLDRKDLVNHYARYEYGNSDIVIHMNLKEYKDYSGFLIPMIIEVEIQGISSMLSEEEQAEARRGLEEMRSELENMPEQQRKMIEQQFAPQIEQIEKMLDGGEMEKTILEVIKVKVY